ncbi:MAG: hypothetical protein ACTS27_10200, partial [Phycisphaerales bacterium]
GGAALTRHYCETTLRETYESGKVYFGRDAFEGLRIMDCVAGGRLESLDEEIEERLGKRAKADEVVERSRAAREGERLKKEREAAGAAAAEGEGGVGMAAPPQPPEGRSDVGD